MVFSGVFCTLYENTCLIIKTASLVALVAAVVAAAAAAAAPVAAAAATTTTAPAAAADVDTDAASWNHSMVD